MQITLAEAETILDMFGFVHGEGGLSDDAYELVERIFAEFPEIRDAKNDDGLPKHSHLLT